MESLKEICRGKKEKRVNKRDGVGVGATGALKKIYYPAFSRHRPDNKGCITAPTTVRNVGNSWKQV